MVKGKEEKGKVVKEDASGVKPGFRQRVHFWCCDRLNVISADDFAMFFDEVNKQFKAIDGFVRAQAGFDEKVADKLGLKRKKDKLMDKESDERGMFG